MVKQPYVKVDYNGKDITTDITQYLIDISVVDKEAGESDELSITLEDTDGLWRGEWYPNKRDKITVELGYVDQVMAFGTFEVDEVEHSGPPDIVTIKGIAAGISKQIRTKRSSAHEGKTLKQIADTVAAANGFTVQGEVEPIQIGRVTQNRETDLAFLQRLASEYGYIFSVRDNKLVFTDVFQIQKGAVAFEIDRTQIKSYSIKDSTATTAKSAKVAYSDPETAEEVEFDVDAGSEEGFTYEVPPFSDGGDAPTTKEDVIEIRTRAENKQQAERKARTQLHAANSKQVSGSIEIEGNPMAVAGMNFMLTGMRKISGKFHITQTTHSVQKSSGYSASLEIKKVGALDDAAKQYPLNERYNRVLVNS